MFGAFSTAAMEREQEQKQIMNTVIGEKTALRERKRGTDATTITLAISREDKQLVKAYAISKHTTVSDLLHQWIQNNCKHF